ncbi:hypothetical protein Salat_1124200 [Sesamum alatum]|uniref:Uncharacterized protein n=1 Tax=Sesamum alatum TaxID=300844 RepID=A0AAE1YDG1_9LAMI|nr:hypothetical protein Salat_1124200 [Sesamum alatum]
MRHVYYLPLLPVDCKASVLIDQSRGQWKSDLIDVAFTAEGAECIKPFPMSHFRASDRTVWLPDTNKFLMENKWKDPLTVVTDASQSVGEFKSFKSSLTTCLTPLRRSDWQAPEQSFIKINCDGAIFERE